MRKLFAIATFIGVGVLSLFSMSHIAFATIFTGVTANYDSLGVSVGDVRVDVSDSVLHIICGRYNGSWFNSPPISSIERCLGNFGPMGVGEGYGLSLPLPSGDYDFYIFPYAVIDPDVDTPLSSISFSWNGTVISDVSVDATRFISFDPGMGNRYSTTTPTASSSVTFYLNNDVEDSEELRMRYSLYRQGRDGVRRLIDGGNDTTWDFFNGTGQYGESTVYFPNQFDYSLEGVYYLSVDMCRPSFWSWSGCMSEVASSTFFIVGDVAGYELAQGEAGQEAYDSYASTTLALTRSCNPLANFSFSTCLKLMIVPSPSILVSRVADVLAIPPWGYVYRLYEIFAFDTASSSLPVISATIPSGIIGAGSSISLDANHALDFVLNSTTSQFLNSSASSTETFFEYTNRYWSVLVYLGFGFYVLSRIIGIRRVNIK